MTKLDLTHSSNPRKVARAAGEQVYLADKLCRRGHADNLRHTATGKCVECSFELSFPLSMRPGVQSPPDETSKPFVLISPRNGYGMCEVYASDLKHARRIFARMLGYKSWAALSNDPPFRHLRVISADIYPGSRYTPKP